MSNVTQRLSLDEYNILVGKKARPSKYNNKKVDLNGVEFDSTRECRRYQDLELMQRGGQIFELKRQVPYDITIDGAHICTWIADFTYRINGKQVTEDVKGFKTPEYKLKKRLVEAIYGVKILET